jgi:2-aminoadipate transaminase
MEVQFADRINKVKKSFIREVLKVTQDPSYISFAGGLPNPASFPISEISAAAAKVLEEDGADALQYSTTEGYLPLRRAIAGRYENRFGMTVKPEDIVITNGSQQGLDLLGKLLLNPGDCVLFERPGYFGAIQALSFYEPDFCSVPLLEDGVDLVALESILKAKHPKLFYTVPNFQNPSGLTYSLENRKKTAALLKKYGTLLVEDDPYGELRFSGKEEPPINSFMDGMGILLGTFSKIVSPAMRLGWICASPEIIDKLVVTKQAADLHTNYFAQRVVQRYLADNDLDEHIAKIKTMYRERCDCMVEMVGKYFPPEVQCTRPEGGMFMWVTLPDGLSSWDLLKLSTEAKVVFVPGSEFYVEDPDQRTFRMNYTNSDADVIKEGISRLGSSIRTLTHSGVSVAR